jgi:chaperonin GroES
MKIEPMGARVLVRPLEKETMTKSGLVLPETAKEKPQQGVIEALGTAEEMTTALAVGDTVLYAKYTGTEIEIEGTKYLVLEENDVLARIAS